MVVRNASSITEGRAIVGLEQPGIALQPLRALFAAGTAAGLTDSELLERYTAERAKSAEAAVAAEMAFSALVDRHGPMVWGVCRRVLGDAHEAEDAFQATFLILVRKARSVRVQGSVGRWLCGVAHRVALRARSTVKRRASDIGHLATPSCDDPAGEAELSDLCTVVGDELDRLLPKYRCPVELCHLQGMTYDEAARQLNCSVATVKNRLTKGLLKLRTTLTQRGLAPSAVAAAVGTAFTDRARAAVPQELVHATVRATTASSTGAFTMPVAKHTESVLRTIMWDKVKLVGLCVFAVPTSVGRSAGRKGSS
jgi:RNA polymerase sigma factor (sigma-70 family)